MARIKINEQLCKGCGICEEACPKECIVRSSRTNAKGFVVFECASPEKCTGCTFCAIACPDLAISVYR